MSYNMRQCRLTKDKSMMVCWIPEKYAMKGKILKIKDLELWLVKEVGTTVKSSDEVIERSQDYKRTRKQSDI